MKNRSCRTRSVGVVALGLAVGCLSSPNSQRTTVNGAAAGNTGGSALGPSGGVVGMAAGGAGAARATGGTSLQLGQSGGSPQVSSLGGSASGGQTNVIGSGGQSSLGGSMGAVSSGGSASGGAPNNGPCPGGVGKALKFDGTVEDFVTANLGTDLPIQRASRTLELWAHFDSDKWEPEHSLIEYGAGQSCHVFGIDVEEVGALDPYGNGCGSDNSVVLVPAVPATGWLHLAWAYDGPNNTFQFTVNGVAQPIPSPHADPAWTTTDSPLLIGGSSEFGGEGFGGVIDEVRVWNIARTPADIARDMRVFLKGNEPGLVAYYHFDEGQGTSAGDSGPHGHTANMVSTVKPMWVTSDIPGTFTCSEQPHGIGATGSGA